ncbi:MAG: hypothetical protein N4A65_11215 [Cohaesibacter sp.]|nr:hypothetical protein [Cohaesibacter sp.]
MNFLSAPSLSSEGLRAVAMAFVLFAITLRAALPLGLAITVNEDGIPLVICQQVANVAAQLNGPDGEGTVPQTPTYQCPYCMVLSADNAPVAAGAPLHLVPDMTAFAVLRPSNRDEIVVSDPTLSDNLGRDPPLFA